MANTVVLRRSLSHLRKHRWPYVLVEGPAGTGKSRGILTVLMERALLNRGCRVLLTRLTRKSLSQSILVTLEDEVIPSFGMSIPGGAHRENRSEYRLPNGSVFVPIGQDNPEALYSTAWDFVYCAETIEVSKDAAMKLSRGLRGVSAGWQQAIFDTNPGASGHWVNEIAQPCSDEMRSVATREDYQRLQRFNKSDPDPGQWKRLVTRHQDNPAYFDASGWAWTQRGRDYIEGKLGQLTGHLRKRLLDGLWCAAEGSVYPNFDETQHAIRTFDVTRGSRPWPIIMGYDPGFDHPAAILWFAIAPDETMYVIDEIYLSGKSVQQLAAMVRDRETERDWRVDMRYADPQHAFSHTAQSPRSIAEQWGDDGFHLSPWPRTAGNEETMVEAVRQRISGGTFRVFAQCRNTIREFQSWSYKRTAGGDLPSGADAFEDRNNHAMDVVKGVVATHPRYDQPGVEVYDGVG